MKKRMKNIYSGYYITRLKVSYNLSRFFLIPFSIIIILMGIIFIFNQVYSFNISISLLIIGFILLVFAYLIVRLISYIFGFGGGIL